MTARRLILAFHQTADRFYPGINNIRPDRFRQMIALLEDWDISLRSITDLETASAQDAAATCTFDDGYVDNLDTIDFLLKREVRPAVFIPTAYIGKRNSWEYSSALFSSMHLNRRQILELAERGVIIGSHGVYHRSLTGLDTSSLREELVDSKRCLEDIIGGDVDSISFPYGNVSRRVIELALENGYRRGYIMGREPGLENEYSGFIRSRVPVYGSDDYFSLRCKIVKQSWHETAKDRIINMLASGSILIRRRLK